ncbi:electron transfer flavoprotein subunit beta/FixA family protein [Planctomycetota bacterium]
MNIIVLIKQVPAPEAIIKVTPDNKSLDVENKHVLNFFDELAIEAALRIKEKVGGAVTVISLSHQRTVEGLRTALAMGANNTLLINDPAFKNNDAYATARSLAEAIKQRTFDLILCGKEAMDDGSTQVGPAVAEFLGIPHISTITKLEIAYDKKNARVERQIEGGKEIINCSLPALFTAQKGLNEPRVPLVSGIMKAMRAKIEEINLAALGLSLDQIAPKIRILKYSSPPKRPQVKIIEGEPEDKAKTLIRLLKEESKII